MSKKITVLIRWAPLGVILLAASIILLLGWHRYLSLPHLLQAHERLAETVENHFAYALLIYISIYIAAIALSLPGGALLTVIGGMLFGWQWGGPAAIFAASTGAFLLFLAARTSLGAALRARALPWLARLSAGFNENGLSYMLFLRLAPLFPFWLVNIAPALIGVSPRIYLLGTIIGIIPASFALSLIGAGVKGTIDSDEFKDPDCLYGGDCQIDIESLLSVPLFLALLALAFLALLPVLFKAWARRPKH